MILWGLLGWGLMLAGSGLFVLAGVAAVGFWRHPKKWRAFKREIGRPKWTPECYSPLAATTERREP